MISSSELSAYYQQLYLPENADLQAVDAAYFKLRAQKIREDARQDVAVLKIARDRIKAYLQTTEYSPAIAPNIPPSADAKITPIEALSAALKQLD